MQRSLCTSSYLLYLTPTSNRNAFSDPVPIGCIRFFESGNAFS